MISPSTMGLLACSILGFYFLNKKIKKFLQTASSIPNRRIEGPNLLVLFVQVENFARPKETGILDKAMR
jgi:hypothetical protein